MRPHKDFRQVLGPEHITEGRGFYEATYPSLRAFADAADGPSAMPIRQRASRESGHDEWGGGSYKEALGYARHGWPEGERKMLDLAERLTEKVSNALPWYGMELGESGGEVDVAALLGGQRENMWDWRDDGGRRPVVRLNLGLTYHADVEPHDVIIAGSVVVSVVDALERMGRRVEIDGYFGIADSFFAATAMVSMRTRLKEADEPLDVPALSFAVAHPGMLRRLGFAWLERMGENMRRTLGVGITYGRPGRIGSITDDELPVEVGKMAQQGGEKAYEAALDLLRKAGLEIDA